MPARFVFTVCQVGAEAALKHELAVRHPQLRFAFSRPGFVTFRAPEGNPVGDGWQLESTFARTWGWSLGKVAGADDPELARAAWQRLREWLPGGELAQLSHLHVWQRDRALPGDAGFEPGITAGAQAAGESLLGMRPSGDSPKLLRVNAPAQPGERVLDCVLVEPHEWWLGTHVAAAPHLCWPGGVPSIAAPANMVSRAYLKIVEALLWSQLPVQPGDRCVEIGSAPGGSCLALLDRGCIVTGVDPAEMDPLVAAHPHFTHVRAKAKDLKRSAFADFRWLMADANVAPNYTLDTVGAIVTHAAAHIEGMLLTLKLTKPSHAAEVRELCERIRSWGYTTVSSRQLAFNRREVCVAAAGPSAA